MVMLMFLSLCLLRSRKGNCEDIRSFDTNVSTVLATLRASIQEKRKSLVGIRYVRVAPFVVHCEPLSIKIKTTVWTLAREAVIFYRFTYSHRLKRFRSRSRCCKQRLLFNICSFQHSHAQKSRGFL